MKFHKHLCQSLVDILMDIFEGGFYADKVLEHHFKHHKKWGGRDRRFLAEATYDIVRWWRRLWYSLDQSPDLNADQLWRLLGAWIITRGYPLPVWPEFRDLNHDIKMRYEGVDQPAIRFSLPDWLFEEGRKQLGTQWFKILDALNQPAPVVLRTNRLKSAPDELIRQLESEGIPAHRIDEFPDAVLLEKRANVFKTKAFQEGRFEVQDASSQLVAPLLDPQPGERIVDACAGAGGKTLHLAALMKKKGKILALDVSDVKLKQLRERASRNGIDIIETKVIESSKTIKRLHETADRLLLDVPCSGSGVWKRNPDSRWKLTKEELEKVQALQQEILSQYSKILKPKGTMVYSTCSAFPSENEGQIRKFLTANSGWELVAERNCSPLDGFDGFYIAKLVKN